MSSDDALKQALCALISEELKLPAARITPSTDLRALGVESIKILRIIAKIERAYDVELDDGLVFRVKTVDELASAIGQLRAGGGPS
jgi:acyl carrier protein